MTFVSRGRRKGNVHSCGVSCARRPTSLASSFSRSIRSSVSASMFRVKRGSTRSRRADPDRTPPRAKRGRGGRGRPMRIAKRDPKGVDRAGCARHAHARHDRVRRLERNCAERLPSIVRRGDEMHGLAGELSVDRHDRIALREPIDGQAERASRPMAALGSSARRGPLGTDGRVGAAAAGRGLMARVWARVCAEAPDPSAATRPSTGMSRCAGISTK